MEADRMPACDSELGRFLRQPEHAIPVCHRYVESDGGRRLDHVHVIHEHLEATLHEMLNAAGAYLTSSCSESHQIASRQAAHARVMGCGLRKGDA
jgi:hypothetical protein